MGQTIDQSSSICRGKLPTRSSGRRDKESPDKQCQELSTMQALLFTPGYFLRPTSLAYGPSSRLGDFIWK